MNKRLLKIGGASLAAFASLALARAGAEPAKPAPASTPAPAPAASIPTLRLTYDGFRLVHTRNVFDPDRRPVRPVAGTPAPPATRTDYAALTGTLLSAEKSYAFFSGSRPEFNRVLTVREKIANATIAGITSANIVVERDGKRTTVAVGQTVPLDNQSAPGLPPVEAPATTTTTTAADAPAPGAATTTTTTTTTATASRQTVSGAANAAAAASTPSKGPPPNLDEIRRRMMEKRQQELK